MQKVTNVHLQELILFSRADLERSIPSMVDGLKPGQRKILFACFKKGLKNDIKVANHPPSDPPPSLILFQDPSFSTLKCLCPPPPSLLLV